MIEDNLARLLLKDIHANEKVAQQPLVEKLSKFHSKYIETAQKVYMQRFEGSSNRKYKHAILLTIQPATQPL